VPLIKQIPVLELITESQDFKQNESPGNHRSGLMWSSGFVRLGLEFLGAGRRAALPGAALEVNGLVDALSFGGVLVPIELRLIQ